jgi:hypothetical protein
MLATKLTLDASATVDAPFHTLVCRQFLFSLEDIATTLPNDVTNLLQEFQDVLPTELPLGLTPLRGIVHQIDLIQ